MHSFLNSPQARWEILKFTQRTTVHIVSSSQKSYIILAVGLFFFFSDRNNIMACFMACKRGTSDCRSQQALLPRWSHTPTYSTWKWDKVEIHTHACFSSPAIESSLLSLQPDTDEQHFNGVIHSAGFALSLSASVSQHKKDMQTTGSQLQRHKY